MQYTLHRKEYKFDVPFDIFSTYQVDVGSDLLLDTMFRRDPIKIKVNKAFDLGSGYGALGIVIAQKIPSAHLTMVDKDLLAIRYAKRNADLNSVSDRVDIFGSVGIDSIEEKDYQLGVSNIPAKIGDSAIEEEFILKPISLLSKGGEYWFVVVNALNRIIPRIGNSNQIDLKQISKRVGHSVYRYIKK
ncbi:methyltransferase [Candidatus Nomurabacteria bacterium]|nr:methyltransferase [Candidatus Nomurabacteria bacterium]MCB9803299.1 methyltransferase [Candidatus Nomurabacteria bacterium]